MVAHGFAFFVDDGVALAGEENLGIDESRQRRDAAHPSS